MNRRCRTWPAVSSALLLCGLQASSAENKPTPRACVDFCETAGRAASVQEFRACASCCTSQRLDIHVAQIDDAVEITAMTVGWTTKPVELLATRTAGVSCQEASIPRGVSFRCHWLEGATRGSLFVATSHGVKGVVLARTEVRPYFAMEIEHCRLAPNPGLRAADWLKRRRPGLCAPHPERQTCQPARPDRP